MASSDVVGVWVMWTMQKSGRDGRRPSGITYHDSMWHLTATGTTDDMTTIITSCGRTVRPHFTPPSLHRRGGIGDRVLSRMPDSTRICKRCAARWGDGPKQTGLLDLAQRKELQQHGRDNTP